MQLYQTVLIFLVVAVIAIGLQVYRISKHLNLSDWTATKKWRKNFEGERHKPRHRPDKISEYATDDDRLFYRDTRHIADWLNEIYAETEWAFENTGELDVSLGSEDGARRRIDGWYNGVKTCWIEVSSFYYDRRDRDVRITVDVINSRMYSGRDVYNLGMSIAQIVCRDEVSIAEARDQILSEMVSAMWQVGTDFGNPEISFRFKGEFPDFLVNWNRQP